MAASTNRGAATTASVQTAQHIRDVVRDLQELDPQVTPFTLILQKEGSRKATNFKFEWPEIGGDFAGAGYAPQVDAVNGTTGTGTSVIVDNGAYFNVGDVVKVARTGELMRVTAISTNTLTVVRGVGSTSTAALADNDGLFILGSSFAEGSGSAVAHSHQEQWKYGYTQIYKHAVSQSNTQQAMANYLGDARKLERTKVARKHKEALERSFLFGERNRDASDTSAPINFNGGITYWATANTKDAGGTLSEPEIEDWLEDVFSHTSGGMKRTLFVSAKVASVLNQISQGRLQTTPGEDVYGVRLKTWASIHGDLMVVKHRFLESDPVGDDGWGGYAFALDMSNLKYRALRDTKLEIGIEAPGDDLWKDQYITECGLEFALPAAHGVLYGVTG
jgi:hypothetical protein